MAKSKLKPLYWDIMDEGKRLMIDFSRPLTHIEVQGIFAVIERELKR
jgi:hypothetical protein